ncbi:hypothetical protein Bbelb_096070 [Branchiostoma belcheri]|nr:hypothetical protein Bbelb_096070 [Branchiostoma belcheri]
MLVTLFRQPSLSFMALSRSSGLQPTSSHTLKNPPHIEKSFRTARHTAHTAHSPRPHVTRPADKRPPATQMPRAGGARVAPLDKRDFNSPHLPLPALPGNITNTPVASGQWGHA